MPVVIFAAAKEIAVDIDANCVFTNNVAFSIEVAVSAPFKLMPVTNVAVGALDNAVTAAFKPMPVFKFTIIAETTVALTLRLILVVRVTIAVDIEVSVPAN